LKNSEVSPPLWSGPKSYLNVYQPKAGLRRNPRTKGMVTAPIPHLPYPYCTLTVGFRCGSGVSPAGSARWPQFAGRAYKSATIEIIVPDSFTAPD